MVVVGVLNGDVGRQTRFPRVVGSSGGSFMRIGGRCVGSIFGGVELLIT